MVRFHRRTLPAKDLEWAGRKVLLRGVESSLWLANRWAGFGAGYTWPGVVEIDGGAARIRVYDLVMLVRLVVLALLGGAVVSRRLLRAQR